MASKEALPSIQKPISKDTFDPSVSIDPEFETSPSFEQQPVRPQSVSTSFSKEDRFSKKEILGEGGMGTVHNAFDHILHRDVAIKSLLKRVSPNSNYWKRFLREAQITAQLTHPSIVPIHDIGFDQSDQPTLVMKKIEGQTLGDFILECSEAINTPQFQQHRHGEFARTDLALKVCDAIYYAHSRGVLHRDLKPENIMVGDFEEIYVMDWGIARTMEDPPEEQNESIDVEDLGVKTLDGSVIGTPAYMSPEQAVGIQSSINYSSDQFSIGLILFELITLTPARTGDSSKILLATAIDGDDQIILKNKELDPRMRAIILRATHPDSNNRYPSVQSLAQDLRRYIRGESVQAHKESFIMTIWRYIASHPVFSLSIFLVIILIASVSTVVALLSALQSQELATKRQNITAHLINAVSEQGRTVDELFAETQILLNGLTTTAHFQLQDIKEDTESCVLYPELADRSRTFYHKRYGDILVSLENPICLLPSGVSKSTAIKGLSLGPVLQEELISIYKRDTPIEEFEDDFKTDDSKYEAQWVYVGLEDGTLINYPGINFYPEEYDPRLRPWYKSGINHERPKCDEPYPDASGLGYLLPCNQQVLDENNRVIGVAGIDISMDSAIDIINQLPLPMINYSFVLNDKGEILLHSKEKGEKLASQQAIEGNQRKQTRKFNNSKLQQQLQIDKTNGLLQTEGEVFVYTTLQFVPWIIVYSFDQSILDCNDCFSL
jgi:eukaryotic-like serine/threonine-protein kinase